MAVKTRPLAREVVAVYTVEKISVELVGKMANNHPLAPVSVECGKRVGLTTAQWRQWMLQLTMFLIQQVSGLQQVYNINQNSDILRHSLNRPTGDRQIKLKSKVFKRKFNKSKL